MAASQEIYEKLVEIRDGGLPLVVSMGSVAASGGYYVSCPADSIIANPGTITDSTPHHTARFKSWRRFTLSPRVSTADQ